MSRAPKQSGQPVLSHRQKQHHLRGDDRERTASARQAAEALFMPKRQPVEPSVSDPVPSAERPARKPRVLSILSPPPVRNEEVAAPVDSEPGPSARSRGPNMHASEPGWTTEWPFPKSPRSTGSPSARSSAFCGKP